MEFNHNIDLINRIISVIVSITSIIGCLFIIVSLSFTKFPRYSHLYYVFMLAVADGMTGKIDSKCSIKLYFSYNNPR
jgi:hypothetical protein